tara:strand:+ start:72 stop:908 length:837 start_codon:yes stop_codon:yes gene_type:complete
MADYYEYPTNLGTGDGQLNHWMSFQGFSFSRGPGTGNATVDIALYIPPDALQTSYKSEYSATVLGQVAGRGLEVLGKGTGIGGIKDRMEAQAAKAKASSSEGMASGFAAFAASKMKPEKKTMMEQVTGAVLSPYLVAAYKGPTDMREHKFTFKFNPHNSDESMLVTKIINAFKSAMLPSTGGGDHSTSPSGTFGYPDEWTITYYINGDELPSNDFNPMFNIGRSVLKSCEVNYATESVPLFFEGTQFPVSAEMSLSFMELEVMTREKITGIGDFIGGH